MVPPCLDLEAAPVVLLGEPQGGRGGALLRAVVSVDALESCRRGESEPPQPVASDQGQHQWPREGWSTRSWSRNVRLPRLSHPFSVGPRFAGLARRKARRRRQTISASSAMMPTAVLTITERRHALDDHGDQVGEPGDAPQDERGAGLRQAAGEQPVVQVVLARARQRVLAADQPAEDDLEGVEQGQAGGRGPWGRGRRSW